MPGMMGPSGLLDMQDAPPPPQDTSLHFSGLPPGFAGLGSAAATPGQGMFGGGPGNPAANPANWGLTLQDLESPLAYSSDPFSGRGQYEPRDTGGYFTLSQLYDFAPGGARTAAQFAPTIGPGSRNNPNNIQRTNANPGGNVPGIFQMGSDAPSTNNWRLLPPPYNSPGWIERNGQIIMADSPQARQGLPWNADPSFSDTAESGTANYQRRVAPGAGLAGIGKYDAYYWPGGNIMGRTRWPYQTDV